MDKMYKDQGLPGDPPAGLNLICTTAVNKIRNVDGFLKKLHKATG